MWQEQQPTVVFITHSVPEALFLADRILLTSACPGQIKAEWRVSSSGPRDVAAQALVPVERKFYAQLDEELAKTFT